MNAELPPPSDPSREPYPGRISDSLPKRLPPNVSPSSGSPGSEAPSKAADDRKPKPAGWQPPAWIRATRSHWLLIALLALILEIPMLKIDSLIEQRGAMRDQVETGIVSKWGDHQYVAGPVLAVPYLGGEGSGERRIAYLLPDRLDVRAKANTEIRRHGIFDIPVYNLELNQGGAFDPARLRLLGISVDKVLWGEATLILPLVDRNTLTSPARLKWGSRVTEFVQGGRFPAFPGAMEARVSLDPAAGPARFDVDFKVNGSGGVKFVPMGKAMRVGMVSSWSSPGFSGTVLPDREESGADGFSAEWSAQPSSRVARGEWKQEDFRPELKEWREASFGVDFATAAGTYDKVRRSTKYSLLFIAMTFLAFYLLDVVRRARVHMVQYVLVGLALCLFYLLLLSLSEHIGFGAAYAAALSTLVLLTGLYSWAVFGKALDALGIGAGIGALYGYLYVVVNAEEHALLFGTLGLLGMLAGTMYATRRLNREKEEVAS